VPKIPLYNKGLGPSVDVATGQLGTSIDAQALSSPARQLASLGETIGRAGQNFAQNQINYNSQKARIDFEFEKAEQSRETDKAANQLSLEFGRLADDYILNSSTRFTTTSAAATAFNESITAKAKSRIAALPLTDRQKSLVERKVLNGLAPKLTSAKTNAFNHGTNESTRSHNARVDSALAELNGSEDSEYLATVSMDLIESANSLVANGGNPRIPAHQIGQRVLASSKNEAIASATTFERLDEIETGIERLMVSSSVKDSLRTSISTRRTALKQEINDGIIGDINSLPLEDIAFEEIDAAIDSVRDKDSVITLMFEVPGVDGTTFEAGRIDLTGAEEGMRERVLNKLIAAKNKKLSDTEDKQVARFASYLPLSNIGEADFDTIETVESLLENARKGNFEGNKQLESEWKTLTEEQKLKIEDSWQNRLQSARNQVSFTQRKNDRIESDTNEKIYTENKEKILNGQLSITDLNQLDFIGGAGETLREQLKDLVGRRSRGEILTDSSPGIFRETRDKVFTGQIASLTQKFTVPSDSDETKAANNGAGLSLLERSGQSLSDDDVGDFENYISTRQRATESAFSSQRLKELDRFQAFLNSYKDKIIGNPAFAKLNLQSDARFYDFTQQMRKRFLKGLGDGISATDLLDPRSPSFLIQADEKFTPSDQELMQEIRQGLTQNQEMPALDEVRPPQKLPNQSMQDYLNSEEYQKWKTGPNEPIFKNLMGIN